MMNKLGGLMENKLVLLILILVTLAVLLFVTFTATGLLDSNTNFLLEFL